MLPLSQPEMAAAGGTATLKQRLCQQLRIGCAEDLQLHAWRGAVFETRVVSETPKHRHHLGLAADRYFWRDNHGLEVDLVFEHAGQLHGVACKSGTTYADERLEPARRSRRVAGAGAAAPVLRYGGESSFERADHRVQSWRDLGAPA